MVDPSRITNYNLNTAELEEHLLFWVCAAGKNGTTAARCLDRFILSIKGYPFGPFKAIREYDKMFEMDMALLMKASGIGCYNIKARTFKELAHSNLDLKTCTNDDLESIHGIGMKTSRCFILHSRKDARVAGLDTHILKYLREVGIENVPKATPGSKREYIRLEKEVLKLADEAGLVPADFDLAIWNKYSVKSKKAA